MPGREGGESGGSKPLGDCGGSLDRLLLCDIYREERKERAEVNKCKRMNKEKGKAGGVGEGNYKGNQREEK